MNGGEDDRRELIADLRRATEAITVLAKEQEPFIAALEAFRQGDVEPFKLLVGQLGLSERCQPICDWLCSKECMRICFELCGPPTFDPPGPEELHELAQIVARITDDDKQLKRLVDAVEKRDRRAWATLVKEFGLERYCHVLCHWVCSVRCRLVCEVLCGPPRARRRDLARELRDAGKAIGRLAENENVFAQAARAALGNQCERLRAVILQTGLGDSCEVICLWLCSWRCVRVCLLLCRAYPLETAEVPALEVWEFAHATAELGARPEVLERLVDAVEREDPDAFGTLIADLGLARFCVQICHWLCYVWCRRFCFCVCPPLVCELTAPTGCVKTSLDSATGQLYVQVTGTAAGLGFGHYTIEVSQDGDPPMAGIVTYPGGGSTGTAPVTNGELARISTATLIDGAYTVTLTVHSALGGAVCTEVVTFNLLQVIVLVTKVGRIPAISMSPTPNNPNPVDEASELRRNYAPPASPPNYLPVAVGRSITMDGMAYIYGCGARKIRKYEIRYARVVAVGGEFAQPGTLDPIPADWPTANRVELLEYATPAHYNIFTRVGPADRNLVNDFGTVVIFGTSYITLAGHSWDSTTAGSGRFSLLLTAEDSIGARFHDVQHVWFDNEPVYGRITGIAGADPCAELKLSQFPSPGMQILGIAWDRLIDAAFPDVPPNDNFDHYRLRLYKQGAGTPFEIGDFTSRMPARKTGPPPTDAEAGPLATFDIAAVIDGGRPGSDPILAIPRSKGCAYYLFLQVWDSSRLDDDAATHYAEWTWPFCIVNDLTSP